MGRSTASYRIQAFSAHISRVLPKRLPHGTDVPKHPAQPTRTVPRLGLRNGLREGCLRLPSVASPGRDLKKPPAWTSHRFTADAPLRKTGALCKTCGLPFGFPSKALKRTPKTGTKPWQMEFLAKKHATTSAYVLQLAGKTSVHGFK